VWNDRLWSAPADEGTTAQTVLCAHGMRTFAAPQMTNLPAHVAVELR
jgi:hypothetical protein